MNVRVKKGELYVIHWLDAAGYMMEDLVKAKPCLCKTVGWVKKIEKDHIVLASSFIRMTRMSMVIFAFCQRAW